MPPPARTKSLAESIKAHLVLLFTLLGAMWALEFVDHLPLVELDRFGIRPRTTAGLAGIVFAPFLHAGFQHLALNSAPFLILGGIVLFGGLRLFWAVTVFVVVAGGLGVWLFAGSFTNHIGASGLIFGYLGFVLARGIFERSLTWMLVACAILAAYGGLLAGLFPTRTGVSWQGHLFGFLAGIAAARLLFPPSRTMLR